MTTPQEAHAWAITIENECTQVFLNKQECEMEFKRLNDLYPESTRRMICLAEKTAIAAQQPQALSSTLPNEEMLDAGCRAYWGSNGDNSERMRRSFLVMDELAKIAQEEGLGYGAAHSLNDSPAQPLAASDAVTTLKRWREKYLPKAYEDYEYRAAIENETIDELIVKRVFAQSKQGGE